MTWALLPVKDLVRAKTRLSGLLTPSERRALAQAMVEDVLAALTASAALDGVLLVSDDPSAGLLAERYGAELLEESSLGCTGLNPVIAAASGRLAERGADAVLVVHSDLPLLTVEDVDALLAGFAQPGTDVLISPDRHHGGTNVMAFATGKPPGLHYGPDSCRAHEADARSRGLGTTLMQRDNVALDVDEPADLVDLCARFQRQPRSGHTARLLEAPGLRQRIALVGSTTAIPPEETGS